MDETQGFLHFGLSNWTICCLLSWFCHKIFPSSWSLYWGVQFLITPKSGNEKKGFTQKWMRDRGFCTLGIQIKPFAACWANFVTTYFHLHDLYTGAPISYYPRERKEGGKRVSSSTLPSICFSPLALGCHDGMTALLGNVMVILRSKQFRKQREPSSIHPARFPLSWLYHHFRSFSSSSRWSV